MDGLSAVQTQLDLVNANSNPSKAQTDSAKLADDLDEFLLLLTTQLQNQDPTEPLDVNEMTNQLVLFSIAEQEVATNVNLEKMLETQASSEFAVASGYIGKVVDAPGNAGELKNGVAQFTYELPANVSETTIVVTDGAGRAVFNGKGPTSGGRHHVVWDGVNSFNGAQMEEGTYFVNILAKDAKGEAVEAETLTSGLVTGAEVVGDDIVLTVAGTSVRLDQVKAVRQATFATNNDGGNDAVDDVADNSSDATGDDAADNADATTDTTDTADNDTTDSSDDTADAA